VSAESSETAITPSAAEMDARAKEAEKTAINRAKYDCYYENMSNTMVYCQLML